MKILAFTIVTSLFCIGCLHAAVPRGLRNQGNSCYMNGAIQALYAITPLTNYLINNKNKYKPHSIVGAYIDLIKQLRKAPAGTIVEPCDFFKPIDKIMAERSKSGAASQQDATEFITIFFDELFDKSLISYDPSSVIFKAAKAAKTQEQYNALPQSYKTTHYSFPHHLQAKTFPSELFRFTTSSKLSCGTCKSTNNKEELAFSLELPIPVPTDTSTTLQESFEKYLEKEQIEGYSCENCAQKVQATKQLIIEEAPEILMIALKRFDMDLTTLRPQKITTPVLIPLEFNAASYFQNSYLCVFYDLIAVVIHLGNYGGGHYTAVVKDVATGQWYYANDSSIQAITTVSNFQTQGYIGDSTYTPYLLVYQKKIDPLPALTCLTTNLQRLAASAR